MPDRFNPKKAAAIRRQMDAIGRKNLEYQERAGTDGISILKFDVQNRIDAENRPLRELGADPDLLEGLKLRGTKFSLEPFSRPGSPSRTPEGKPHPKPHNASAFEQILRHYKDLTTGLVYLSESLYPNTEYLSLQELFNVANVANILPLYLTYQGGRPPTPTAPVPAQLAVMQKAMEGVNVTIGRQLEEYNMFPFPIAEEFFFYEPDFDRMHPSGKPIYMGAEEYVAGAEKSSDFIGESLVCSAPTRMVRDVLDTMIHPNGKSIPSHEKEFWRDLIPEPSSLVRFAALVRMFRSLTNQNFNPGRLLDQVVNIHNNSQNLDITAIKRATNPYIKAYFILEEIYLKDLLLIEPEINKSIGRNPPSEKVTASDIRRFFVPNLPRSFWQIYV